MRGRKKAGESMVDEVERILRNRPVTAEELAGLIYGDDTAYYRQQIREMISRIKGRRGAAVQRTIMYSIGG